MIHVVLGTKAQLIKMAPVMVRLRDRGLPYRFVSTGQHRETMDDILENFGLPGPDVRLYDAAEVSSVGRMAGWAATLAAKAALFAPRAFAGDRDGIVLVHGDTLSTLLGALMGRRAGLTVGHVESGLRSHDLLHPFPEELTRLAVFRLSHLLFCPGAWAADNVSGLGREVVDTGTNTLTDAAALAREAGLTVPDAPAPPYGVVSLHRYENVSADAALRRVLELVDRVAARLPLVFVLHPVTEQRLRQSGLMKRLEADDRITLRPRMDYFRFVTLLDGAELVVTDGGSIQEESSYLGLPCLLLRKATERNEGLGTTAVLSGYDPAVVDDFLDRYPTLRVGAQFPAFSASDRIVEAVARYA